MQAISFPARQARNYYRHELRTLTYVTLDGANGGIIRNLNHEGVAVQAVTALRPQQRVRLRFELRFPRLRVETNGQVSWATPSGQCCIRFVDLPARTRERINHWIFSNLLNAVAGEAGHPRSIFGVSVVSIAPEGKVREENTAEENDGLTLSAAPRPAIRLEPGFSRRDEAPVLNPPVPHASVLNASVLNASVLNQHSQEDLANQLADHADARYAPLNWLSQPLSGRALSWLVDALVVIAAVLMFAVIFLSIAHGLPPWPLTLGAVSVATVFVAAIYWAIFAVFEGSSLGARLAQVLSGFEEKEESEDVVRIR
jgi:PilZ domain